VKIKADLFRIISDISLSLSLSNTLTHTHKDSHEQSKSICIH